MFEKKPPAALEKAGAGAKPWVEEGVNGPGGDPEAVGLAAEPSLGDPEGETEGEASLLDGEGALDVGGLITGEAAFLGGLVVGEGELGEEEAGATTLTSSFIPRSQWPAVPQMKHLFPGESRRMTVLPLL